jgi:hypothetical protein
MVGINQIPLIKLRKKNLTLLKTNINFIDYRFIRSVLLISINISIEYYLT